VTAEAREDGRSTKLKDLIADPVWAEAVEASPLVEHYLSAMPYDEFVAAEGARVLSYRASNIAHLDCMVADPAGSMERTRGAMPLSLLDTPSRGWTHLWSDALNHLNDPAGAAHTLVSSGPLYLAVRTLPQFWLGGSYEAAAGAMSRAWVHQELAFGRLDRGALEKFVGLCCSRYKSQTQGVEWKGNPADLDGPKLLSRLIGTRVKAAATHGAMGQAACEWFACVNKVKKVPVTFTSGVGSVAECAALLAELYDVLESKQVSDIAADNLAALRTDPSLAWSVVKSYGNANVFERTDMYVSALGALGAACGVAVADPLAAFKAKFFRKGVAPASPDGSLRYTHGDVDLGALNANHALLRACWEALLPLETLRDMPAVITGLVTVDKATVDWSVYPPGIATLGLGPVAVSGLQHGKLKLGKCIGVDFTGEGPPPAHGYYSRGYVKCVEGEGLEGTPEGTVPGEYVPESFSKDFAGFHPSCKWNVSMVEREAKSKVDDEFGRTLVNLWAAWLEVYDADDSHTISLEELKKFAGHAACPSSNGYMQTLHDWARTAALDGSLESSFNEVDRDGSGELEFREFQQMLGAEQ